MKAEEIILTHVMKEPEKLEAVEELQNGHQRE